MSRRIPAILLAGACLWIAGCLRAGNEVVVYTALDGEFSQPVFDDFTARTQIPVAAKFDTESTKTVGLARAILAERGRPRCDVFWNNEILNTLRLEKEGLLAVYRPAVAEKYPVMFRSPRGTWHGFAARARILLVNTRLVAADQRPASILDLADARWQGRAGMAKPLFGTTATQAVCLFAHWGDLKAEDFFRRLKKNKVEILSGNKQVALAVAAGQIAFGLTDTDDAMEEVAKGSPVTIVYPDQGPHGLGTLFIPNTVALVAGAPHPDAAKRLIGYLLSPAVEARLAEGPSAQIPLNPQVHVKVRVETPRTVKPMPIDFSAAVDHWDAAARFLRDEFTGP